MGPHEIHTLDITETPILCAYAYYQCANVVWLDLEYLAALARKGLTGVARARKVAAIREYFRFLEGVGVIERSPAAGIDTPKREKQTRQFLRSDEYTKMLSLAGGNPRDYAILQVFLQTGIRVSELASLNLEDLRCVKVDRGIV